MNQEQREVKDGKGRCKSKERKWTWSKKEK
jgi:hypothetical protein